MPGLNYKIGGLKINKEKLELTGSDSRDAIHKFVTYGENDIVSIFVAEANQHPHIASKFSLNKERLVGGGNLYLDKEKRLVLSDYSVSYGTIPKEAAQNLGELVAQELVKEGIVVNGVLASPRRPIYGAIRMDGWWRDLGFE